MAAKTLLQVFKDARNVLTQYGWRQGLMGSPTQGFCAVGALRFAINKNSSCSCAACVGEEESVFTNKAIDTFSTYVPNGHLTIWNDASERTKEEVLALFDKVIGGLTDGP